MTSIESGAFTFCKSLREVTIPGSVTKMGEGAFLFCEKLNIYVQAASQPEGWEKDWCGAYNENIQWGYTGQ